MQTAASEKLKQIRFCNVGNVVAAINYSILFAVKSLLSQNVSPNETNEDGLTALHQVWFRAICDLHADKSCLKTIVCFGWNWNSV